MKPLNRRTLLALLDEMPTYPWRFEDREELVAPQRIVALGHSQTYGVLENQDSECTVLPRSRRSLATPDFRR
jgi:hypothetical protein